MRKNPHVRICGGLGSATTLVYPTSITGRGEGFPVSFAEARALELYGSRHEGYGVAIQSQRGDLFVG